MRNVVFMIDQKKSCRINVRELVETVGVFVLGIACLVAVVLS